MKPKAQATSQPPQSGLARSPHQTDALAGLRVRLRRKELGLSQSDLAAKLGITFQQVQKYEKGTNRISASRLQSMSDILGVPISYFFPEPMAGETPDRQVLAALDLVKEPAIADLMRGFGKLKNADVRKAVYELVMALADEGQATTRA